jgi:carbamoylphosphate synthase small subunit
MKAILALEDGSVFHGQGFGVSASACGEVCFNIPMICYQKILTCPLIGNCGVNHVDVESWRMNVVGFVVHELSPVVSNWRAEQPLIEKDMMENTKNPSASTLWSPFSQIRRYALRFMFAFDLNRLLGIIVLHK